MKLTIVVTRHSAPKKYFANPSTVSIGQVPSDRGGIAATHASSTKTFVKGRCSLSLVGHVRVALVASTSGDKVGDAVGEPRARPQTARRHRAMNERGAMVFEKDSNLPERTLVTSS